MRLEAPEGSKCKQRTGSINSKSAQDRDSRDGQEGNSSRGGWKMKKEVGICFEFCRQIGLRGWESPECGSDSPAGDVIPQRRGESTHTALGRTQAERRKGGDDPNPKGVRADEEWKRNAAPVAWSA